MNDDYGYNDKPINNFVPLSLRGDKNVGRLRLHMAIEEYEKDNDDQFNPYPKDDVRRRSNKTNKTYLMES